MNVLIKLVYMCYMCNKWPIKLDNYLCMLYEKQRDKRGLLFYTCCITPFLRIFMGWRCHLYQKKQSEVLIYTYIADIGQSLGYVIEYTSEIKQGKMESLQEGESLLKNRKWVQDKLPCFLRHTVPGTWL